MSITPLNMTDLNASVAEAISVFQSVNVFIDGIATKISQAVKDALTVDNLADQNTINNAQAAIDSVVVQLKQSAKATADALVASTGLVDPTGGGGDAGVGTGPGPGPVPVEPPPPTEPAPGNGDTGAGGTGGDGGTDSGTSDNPTPVASTKKKH